MSRDAVLRELADSRVQIQHLAGKLLDKRAKRYMLEHNEPDYSVAMQAVLDADPVLKKQYVFGGD